MRGVARGRLQGQAYDPLHVGIRDLPRGPGPRFIEQAVQTLAHKPLAPAADGQSADAQVARHPLVGIARRTPQHDPGSLRHGLRRCGPTGPALQRFSFLSRS